MGYYSRPRFGDGYFVLASWTPTHSPKSNPLACLKRWLQLLWATTKTNGAQSARLWWRALQNKGDRLEVHAEVRDNVRVDDVWAVIYPPGYLPPKSSEELVAEPLPITRKPRGDDWYGGVYGELTETGTYRIVVYAEDNNALLGRPKETTLTTGWQLFLPMLLR